MATQSTTTLYTFKNKKGEVVATVRGASQTDAQYKAGISPDYVVSNAPTTVVEKEYITFDTSGHKLN